jgi:5-carboxymethyl-2-hydroxymuconate isomerase
LTKASGPSTDTASFEITETNLYRRLVHLSLELGRGTDARIRQHLADRLVHVQSDLDDLTAKFRSSEAEVLAAQREASELRHEVDRLRREKTEQVELKAPLHEI